MMLRAWGRVVFLLLWGCGDDAGGPTRLPDAAPPDAAPADAAGDAGVAGCNRQLAAADRVRRVVVSHPYDARSQAASDWEVLALSEGGTLATGGPRFQMGRATSGQIALTPDGEVGVVAQEDGSLGVFSLDADGTPHTIAARLAGSFYAMRVVMDPSGDFVWILDTQWRENGGGIYRVRIGCDGTPADDGLWAPSKLPAGLAFVGGGRLLVQATDLLASPSGSDVFLVDPAGPTITAQAASFGDAMAIVSALAMSSDGQYALVADNNEFSGIPNRIAVVAVSAGAIAHRQVLSPVQDPVALVPSPFDDTILVASGYGNALIVVEPQASATAPYRVRGEITYQGARPQLPGDAVAITRGLLRGRVLVTETSGIRAVQFGAGGTVTDRGVISLGGGVAALVGAIGIQP